MNRVDGKVAIVTGAARGIGERTAAMLAECGAKVVLTDLLEETVGEATARINEAGGTARALRHDVTSEADWENVIADCMEAYGRLDVLVNNAGIFVAKPIEATTLEDWHRISHVNLDGVFLGTKYAIGAMKQSPVDEGKTRSIVNLSSIAGIVGGTLGAAYHMTKGGVRLFTKAAALECAALGYNIRVNSVHPGVIDTDMCDEVLEGVAERVGDLESAKIRVTDTHPLKRLGHVDDIANAIVFLASEDSSFMTGSEVVVDGGVTAG